MVAVLTITDGGSHGGAVRGRRACRGIQRLRQPLLQRRVFLLQLRRPLLRALILKPALRRRLVCKVRGCSVSERTLGLTCSGRLPRVVPGSGCAFSWCRQPQHQSPLARRYRH